MLKLISGNQLRKMVVNAAKIIEINKEHVDALNVFPVPDGDTGTNMSLTMMSAAKEVSNCPSNNIEELSKALSTGALRGARGNSGVILSQILKGMASVIAEAKDVIEDSSTASKKDAAVKGITTKTLAKALAVGSAVAYKAVTVPKEGTILTIIRAMAEQAGKIAKKTVAVDEFLLRVIDVGEDMLKQTPEMLPMLKKAGVIDAGGRGLLVIFKGFYNSLVGLQEHDMSFDDRFSADGSEASIGAGINNFDFTDLAEIEYTYCTEFFVINLKKRTTEADIEKLREALMTIGDSVLCIGDLKMVKVHVHTNEPGTALTYALELGEIDGIKIENMLEQYRALIGKQKESLAPFGMVAICAGEGLNNIFKDLTVYVIVEGGQTMNPSADDIAKAADKIPAENVFIFPNNKNIILAAEQAKMLSKRKLHVIPTKNIPEGVSAVLNFNPDDTLENNILSMNAAIPIVKSGAVTYAVRSTKMDNFVLNEGDIIAVENSAIVATGADIGSVTEQLVDIMVDDDASNITLYFGSDVTEDSANSIAEDLSAKYSKLDVDVHFGGQPLYYYIVSVE